MIYSLGTRALRLLPPEPAHNFTIGLLKRAPSLGRVKLDPRLRVALCGQTWPSPLGLAAGFDKQGEVMGPMLDLGFGFVEVGSITPQPQPGNPKPRAFRAPAHGAVINRYGFNSDGHAQVHERLSKWRTNNPLRPLGINLGMNKTSPDPVSDYLQGIAAFEGLATYLVVNLSSPNTPGLRTQQNEGLGELIQTLLAAKADPSVPLFLKVAPDLEADQIEAIANAAMAHKLPGLIVSNTTLDRPTYLPESFRSEAGGLSGAPLTDKALNTLSGFFARTQGSVPLIGVGGIMNGAHAVARLRAGADLLQIYSGLMYRGPKLITEIHTAILNAMVEDGVDRVQDLKKDLRT